ncbi:hypothetical protein HYU23_02830 [Candidatus Woesearchaeota archaeon]|nr:hypothetical protein [Candidatus Woesearchaeota archaeon]
MLLNIIHPYTFKLSGSTLKIGPVPEFRKRDKKVEQLARKVLSSGGKVIYYKYSDGNFVKEVMHESALHSDPIYQFLYGSVETVTTTPYGIPIPDEKPAKIEVEAWKLMTELYTRHSELRQIIEGHENVVFIGGALEKCLANAAIYFNQHYREPGQKLLYVPELCVSFNADEKERAVEKLSRNNIELIKFTEVMSLN